MSEPISIVLGTLGLTEGVKFLFAQAGELLKRRRERREKAAAAGAASPPTESVTLALPTDVFEGQLTAPKVHHDKLTELEPRLKELRGQLLGYREDLGAIQAGDEKLGKTLDDLRRVLEVVYQQPLRFKGEPARAVPFVHGEVHVSHALGCVTGVDVETLHAGNVAATVVVGTAEDDVVGVKVGTVGSSQS